MRKFRFREHDAVGSETLEAIGKARRFNRWMYETIKPWCSGDIMEVGSGHGNISEFFITDHARITLTDIRENYCEKLTSRFSDAESLQGVVQMDLTDPEFEIKHQNLFEKFDTIFALNVVEHIEEDKMAVANCKKLLKKGGMLIILVPSYQSLYNNFDVDLGHFRRYNIASLSSLFEANQLEIIQKQYFNFAGMFGWFFSGRILKKKIIPTGQVKIFDLLVPIFKIGDRIVLNSMGLSTIIVGRK